MSRFPLLIRQETGDDENVIDIVNDTAFGRPHEARLVRAIRESNGFDPRLSLVAEVDRGAGEAEREVIGVVRYPKAIENV